MSLNHLAIILDGNRRWALSNNLESFEGHSKGAENLWQIIRDVDKKKINVNSLDNIMKIESEDFLDLNHDLR